MQSRGRMLARMLGSDPTADGQFVVAVRTTRIYCLPSCRPSRKPKPENVTFYATPAEARAAGYRACKLCKPDDFYSGHHAGEALIEGLVARLAAEPGAFRDIAALAAAGGVGASKLHDLVRVHYHTTPAAILSRARVAAAQAALLAGSRPVAEIGYAAGFESLSTFNDRFRRLSALAPLDYRRLRERDAFTLALPPHYPTARLLRYLGRDPGSLTERVAGDTYQAVLRLGDGPDDTARVRVTFAPGAARCEIAGDAARAHGPLLRVLGLAHDPARFEAQVAGCADLAPLLDGQRGLRVPLIADPFDAVLWAIAGQQITLSFTYTLRRRLIARLGGPTCDGLHAPPTAGAVAALEPGDLTALGFSRAKADYLVGAARAIAAGTLPLAALAGASATRIERTLLAVRGIGPWSAHYLLMRHYGFLDCVPLGDAGLTASLQRFFALAARPDRAETLRLMGRFSPYRSLATFHLWQRLGAAA